MKTILFTFLCIFFSLVCSFFLAECALRFLPVPGLKSFNAKYNETIGGGYYPNSTIIFSDETGKKIVRGVNRWGYLDVDHELKKEERKTRIGFFGDSFTEARQVPIESTFFSIAEECLNPSRDVECLSFGITGIGTLHSYLLCKKNMSLYDLDIVAYVFYDNDLGDNISRLKNDPGLPYAILEHDGFRVDNSFRDKVRYKQNLSYNATYWCLAHSLTLSTAATRLILLRQYGRQVKSSEQNRLMATQKTSHQEYPNVNDLPSTWPDSLKEYAVNLGAAIILQWKQEVEEDSSRRFVVTYVPRPGEWRKPTISQDSWKPWLVSFCRDHKIVMIDPTDEFIELSARGAELYADHFSVDGHRAFAGAFVHWFETDR